MVCLGRLCNLLLASGLHRLCAKCTISSREQDGAAPGQSCAEDPTAPAPCGQLSAQTSVSRCCARGLLGPRSAPRTASQASAKGTKVHRHSVRVCVADPLAFAGEASSAGRTARPAGSTRRCGLRAGTALCARRCPVLLRLTFHCLTRLQVTS